jgi:tetratricopeptide (TPR) repeat protein
VNDDRSSELTIAAINDLAPAPFGGLAHGVFLARVADQPAVSPAARLGQGAFLALRLVDLLRSDAAPVTPDVFRYQHAATERYCQELDVGAPEAAHLVGLVQSAMDAHRAGRVALVGPALFAYAHFLEDEGQYEEALDVLETMLAVGAGKLSERDLIAGLLRNARVLRKLGRFEEAQSAYAAAGERAERAGDRYSHLLSRLGRTNISLTRGNLAAAQASYEAILADAALVGERDAQARAEHGLGVTHDVRGRRDAAVPHFWNAFQMYEDEQSKLRVLADLGLTMRALGEYDSAEHALRRVVDGVSADAGINPMIELMYIASARGDRVGFERWRERAVAREAEMTPNSRVDFYLKASIGIARFGSFGRAADMLATARALAAEHGLHEFEFRIERIQAGLPECERALDTCSPQDQEPRYYFEPVREVAASLAQLVW